MYSNPEGTFNLSVPNKMYRNPKTFVQMSYQSYKIAEHKKKLEAAKAADAEGEEGAESAAHEQDAVADF